VTPTESSDVLSALVASAPDALYLVDGSGAIRFANPAALAVLGYDDASELIGRPSHRTIHDRHPDGTPYPEEDCPLLLARSTGETVRVERDWFVRRDGSMVPVAYASAPVELDGGRGAIVTFRDTTRELLAEEALQARALEQARLEEVTASRARLVEAADAERRRLARDLHDGAQQHLVQALLELGLAQRARSEPDEHLAQGLTAVRTAIDDLRELAQGIHPRVLVDHGLAGALASLADRPPVPVEVDVSPPSARYAPSIEVAVYFVVAEALTNVAKHAGARSASVRVREEDGELLVDVVDDGRGGAALGGPSGSGLRGIGDRVAAIGGALEVVSDPGQGTTLTVRLPLSGAAR